MDWLDEKIKDYYEFLHKNTYKDKDTNTNWFIISTPFLGAFNDPIELFVKKEEDVDNKIIISDDGVTLYNLELQGVSFVASSQRKSLLERVINTYGLKLEGGEIQVSTTIDKFAQRKYDIISAIQEINAFHVLSKSTVSSVFKEDVRAYLDSKNIIYTPEFISKGKTGLDFTFDFQIARKNTETVIKAFNSTSINTHTLSSFIFSWEDIKETRSSVANKKLKAIMIINDTEKPIEDKYITAIVSKGAGYIPWSNIKEEKFYNLLVN